MEIITAIKSDHLQLYAFTSNFYGDCMGTERI